MTQSQSAFALHRNSAFEIHTTHKAVLAALWYNTRAKRGATGEVPGAEKIPVGNNENLNRVMPAEGKKEKTKCRT